MQRSEKPLTLMTLIKEIKKTDSDYSEEAAKKYQKLSQASLPEQELVNAEEIIQGTQIVFGIIQKLLEAPGNHQENVKKALSYLEMVTIADTALFSSQKVTTLGERTKKRFSPVGNILSPEDDKPPMVAFPKNESEKLMEIYSKIQDYSRTMSWHFSYPLNSEGQVMSNGIGEWQRQQIPLHSSPDGEKDFKRKYKISNLTYEERKAKQPKKTSQNQAKTEEQKEEKKTVTIDPLIEEAIDQLVNNANGYPEGNVDPKLKQWIVENGKPALKEWLIANGGQDNDRFFDYIIAKDQDFFENKIKMPEGKEFTTYGYRATNCVPANTDWVNAKNGKIQFEYTMNVYSILITEPEGKDLRFMPELPKNLDEYKNSYIFANDKLWYIQAHGKPEQITIKNNEGFHSALEKIKTNVTKDQVHLSRGDIIRLITDNGGQSHIGCDLMKMSSPPTLKTFNALPIQSNGAYVMSGNKLFYLNKLFNLNVEIPVTKETLKKMEAMLQGENTKTLTAKELRSIEDMTNQSIHMASAFLVRENDGKVYYTVEPPMELDKLSPLMRLDARVEPDFFITQQDEVKIRPKIVRLDITCYAGDILKSPAQTSYLSNVKQVVSKV